VVFTNQIQDRDSPFGIQEKTPGGHAVPFFASLRIRVGPSYPSYQIKKTATIHGGKQKRSIGIHSNCYVFKSTIDSPYREAPIFIIFNYGIDDIRGNLVWLKDISGGTSYNCIDKEYKTIDSAIQYIEEQNLQQKLREKVIDTWHEVEESMKVERKPKIRF